MSSKIKENNPIVYQINGKSLSFEKPMVMAIINLTPDSFYDGGKYSEINDVLRDAEEKVKQGALILDIGAASSRSGSKEISEEEEWKRVQQPLLELRKKFNEIFISVDTYRAEIARRAAECGADIINDISGGNMDAGPGQRLLVLRGKRPPEHRARPQAGGRLHRRSRPGYA